MKTLLEKMKAENLQKLESYKDKFPTSVKSCLKSLSAKNYWIELSISEAMLILSFTTNKILDVENITELFILD
jgi:lipoate-protein ligase A